MPKIYIMGFVGCGNLGDEAVLAGTLQGLRDSGINDPIVFSWNPELTSSEHGVKTLPVLPGFGGLKHFASHFNRGDLLLLGGGSLLQDGQKRIVPFWLSRAAVAKLKGCTVVYHAQGVGPLQTNVARMLVNSVVPLTAGAFTVRDAKSRELLPKSVKVELVADPALLLPELSVHKVPHRIVISLRNTKSDAELAALVQALKLFKPRAEFVFLPMHLPDDREVCRHVAVQTEGVVYEGPFSVTDVRRLLASAELVLAMRLHAAILAAGVSTPSIGLSYDPKVSAFYNELGLPEFALPWQSGFNPATCGNLLLEAYDKRRELAKEIKVKVDVLRKRAHNSVPIALAEWRRRS